MARDGDEEEERRAERGGGKEAEGDSRHRDISLEELGYPGPYVREPGER